MKRFVILTMPLILMLFPASPKAQSAQDSVKQVIEKLFTAMKNSDSLALTEVFAPQSILQSIGMDKEGQVRVRTDDVRQFISFVGKQPKGAADERIRFESVKIDGHLASVWTPYQFYYNGNFSHCGVNSFQLVRIGGTWKIQHLIDTRRKTGCN